MIVTGKGTSGSWKIRGEQLGRAIGARIAPLATAVELRRADVVVGVKRLPQDLVDSIHRSGARFVWDCVDVWPQRQHARWSREESLRWVAGELNRLRPDLVIWPNDRMRADVGRGGAVLRHHAMPEQPMNPIRETVRVIGYQGSPQYLSMDLLHVIHRACSRVGASFTGELHHLADIDVCLALRSDAWRSYPQQHWKPATKLTNAHATGTPWIGNTEIGYKEIAAGGEEWVDDPVTQLEESVARLLDVERRREISRQFLAATYSLQAAANDLRSILCM